MVKFQTVAIIFIILIVPISLLLTYYINSQIDTIAIQNSYDTKLLNATYDAIIAFQLNTVNNKGYSTNAESLRRDINASIKTFRTSLANNLGVTGSGDSFLAYIPAVVYTLYDGYYIYAPIANTTIGDDGKPKTTYEHTLKPYVYYTARYKFGNNTDFVVNYSLDNYIVVYGNINGEYISKAGYLTNYDKYEKTKINENLKDDAARYYSDTKEFTTWVNNTIGKLNLDRIDENYEVIEKVQAGSGKSPFYIDDKNDPDDKISIFCEHKSSIIKKSIQTNLQSAINTYTAQSDALGTSYDFKIPILDETEWDKMLSNVSIMTFLQGLQMGMKTYNNYMIVSSTGNSLYVDPEALYFVTSDSSGNYGSYYHRINCPLLAEEVKAGKSIEGHVNTAFNGIYDSKINTYKYFGAEEQTDDKGDVIKYTYPKGAPLACYECIVASKVGGLTFDSEDKDLDTNGRKYNRIYAFNTNNNLITFTTKYKTENEEKDYTGIYNGGVAEKLRNAYYNALFKERKNLVKVSSYVNKAN